MECPDGFQRRCFPLLAHHICDHVEGLKATITKQFNCTGCEASAGELHYVGCPFRHKNSAQMKVLYQELRTGVLDDNDNVLEGREAELARREQRFLGCRWQLTNMYSQKAKLNKHGKNVLYWLHLLMYVLLYNTAYVAVYITQVDAECLLVISTVLCVCTDSSRQFAPL